MSIELGLKAALAAMIEAPTNLVRGVEFHATQMGRQVARIEENLIAGLSRRSRSEVFRVLHQPVTSWDFAVRAPWAKGALPNTPERRARIYALLGLSAPLAEALDEAFPVRAGKRETVVEAGGGAEWFTPAFRASREFYWKHYSGYLKERRGFSEEGIALLDEATSRVVERLAEPSSRTPRSARGLVVGYVQSGKTTNFTGVIAKAIDAGYKLIIVLSGTMDLLRNQTQRRLDLELAGVQNVLAGGDPESDHEYKGDDDWPKKFVDYGDRPARLGSVNIIRLTRREDDFESLSAGLSALEIEKRSHRLPLYDRENLEHANARLVVIKKNAFRLDKLMDDLLSLGRDQREEMPALIIDDESDQASVNTIEPGPTDDKERTAINGRLVELLKLLPRAQYVGYTATPFANVFVDPFDAEDIYPRDFIISLPRPDGYMGVREFHDLDPVPEGTLSNEDAFVRGVSEADADSKLESAIDAFVLSGAIKLWRERHKVKGNFRHHTMLVHESARQADQFEKRDEILRLWTRANYSSPTAGLARLKVLFESEFRGVWQGKGRAAGLPWPANFAALRADLGEALDRIRQGEGPVLVVNGDPDADRPDFDAVKHVWKIVVGGAKLSRGYTVEGLTVSYFRRRAKTQDTLMQMGRWFGYRQGYTDLVRLFIARDEPLDLYEAFGAMCSDEEAFRDQLERYARPLDGGRPITPLEVPALVFNSHPELRPAAKNKMFNAVLKWAGFDSLEPTQQAADEKGRRHNEKLFSKLLGTFGMTSVDVKGSKPRISFRTMVSRVPHAEMMSVLDSVAWHDGQDMLKAEREFLRRKPHPVGQWIVLLPQLGQRAEPVWKVGDVELSVHMRKRLETRFNVFTTSDHRALAEVLVGKKNGAALITKPALKASARTGLMLLYPTLAKGDKASKAPVMGFALYLPDGGHGTRAAFTVQVPSAKGEVVVPARRRPGRRPLNRPRRPSRRKKRHGVR